MFQKKFVYLWVIVLLVLAAGLAGCGSSNKVSPAAGNQVSKSMEGAGGGKRLEVDSTYSHTATRPAQEHKYPAGDPNFSERLIIKNAEISLMVQNLTNTVSKIEKEVALLNGFVSDSNMNDRFCHITLRVPADKFLSLLGRIEKLGKIKQKRIFTEDVTRQYIDLEARIKTLKEQEDRLRDLLEKANTIEDILKIEKELTRIRGEIESKSGEFRYLKNRLSYSTINLSIEETVKGATKVSGSPFSGLWQKAVSSLINSINVILSGAAAFVVFLFGFLPYLIIIAAGICIILYARKKLFLQYFSCILQQSRFIQKPDQKSSSSQDSENK